MKTLKRIVLAAALAVSALMAASCNVSKISLESAGVKYVVPTSMHSFDAMLQLEVNNPSVTFRVQEVDGLIKVDGEPFAKFTTGELLVEGKQTLCYELPARVVLEPGVSVLELLKLCSRRSLDGIKADVNMKVSGKNGTLKAPLKYKDIDFAEFSRK